MTTRLNRSSQTNYTISEVLDMNDDHVTLQKRIFCFCKFEFLASSWKMKKFCIYFSCFIFWRIKTRLFAKFNLCKKTS